MPYFTDDDLDIPARYARPFLDDDGEAAFRNPWIYSLAFGKDCGAEHWSTLCAGCRYWIRRKDLVFIMRGPRGFYGRHYKTHPAIHGQRACLYEYLRKLPCHYCGGEGGSVDHVIPRTLDKHWRQNEPQGTVPACTNCNSSKGNRLVIPWLADQTQRGRLNRHILTSANKWLWDERYGAQVNEIAQGALF